MNHILIKGLCLMLLLGSQFSFAGKMVKLEGIKIQGDNEAPQVMYIIPWQNSKGAERLYSPVRGAPIERLRPLDPYSFGMEQSLHKQWVDAEKVAVDPAGN